MARKAKVDENKPALKVLRGATLALLALMLALAALLFLPGWGGGLTLNRAIEEKGSAKSFAGDGKAAPSATPTQYAPLAQVEPFPSGSENSRRSIEADLGAVLISITEGGNARLFVYTPDDGRLLRLTTGDWDDIAPAVSPDGKKAAFSSNRGGKWDLFLISLEDGTISQLTDTPEFESSPSWSPDGLWLAYEAYLADETGGNLEIFIRSVDNSQKPIRLTDDPAADFSPMWAPGGREIAFVSTRSGDFEIWSANLDEAGERFSNLSRDSSKNERHPAWSPDGSRLAWSVSLPSGVEQIAIWDSAMPDNPARELPSGSWPIWSPSGEHILTVYSTPNQFFLTVYRAEDGRSIVPLRPVAGEIRGMSWIPGGLAQEFMAQLPDADEQPLPPLWIPQRSGLDKTGRAAVVDLAGVRAPLASLHDLADEAFVALRERVAAEAGWDYLSTLESAYLPLTSPLEPGGLEDWLYTGRALLTNTAPAQAGWLAIAQEAFGPEVYWRIYLRALNQDGKQGEPLREFPFDLGGRHSGDARAYEAGGRRLDEIPAGYWVDFTRLAAAYGWERLPSLSTWRISYSGVRYNEIVLREGLGWLEAMMQIYPRAALNTPTKVLSPTPSLTPTATSTPPATPTSTRYVSPTPTLPPTRRPLATSTPGK